MNESYADFFGRPPLAPLVRAASALASDVTLPPLRPRATAAGFLRGTPTPASYGQCLFPQGLPDAVRRHQRLHDLRDGQMRERGWNIRPCRQERVLMGLADGQGLVLSGKLACLRHGLLEAADVSASALCHGPIKPNRLGSVKWAAMGHK